MSSSFDSTVLPPVVVRFGRPVSGAQLMGAAKRAAQRGTHFEDRGDGTFTVSPRLDLPGSAVVVAFDLIDVGVNPDICREQALVIYRPGIGAQTLDGDDPAVRAQITAAVQEFAAALRLQMEAVLAGQASLVVWPQTVTVCAICGCLMPRELEGQCPNDGLGAPVREQQVVPARNP